MKILFENWRGYLKEEEGIGCPIRGAIYGGIPSGGDFLATTEYEVAASNIAEAAHCILGSLGKRIGGCIIAHGKSPWCELKACPYLSLFYKNRHSFININFFR